MAKLEYLKKDGKDVVVKAAYQAEADKSGNVFSEVYASKTEVQQVLPTKINDRFLHVSSTGTLEWSTVTQAEYSAGNGLLLTGNTFSIDGTVVALKSDLSSYSTTSQMNTAIANHHDDTKYDASNPNGYITNAYHDTTKADIGDVTAINNKIPAEASSTNKLVDRALMNQSLQEMAANYVTYDATGNNFPTKAALLGGIYYHDGSSYSPTKNDYAVVNADETHDGASARYIYTGTTWGFQYTFNDQPFSPEEQAALQSGITSAKVSTYDGYAAEIAGKADMEDIPVAVSELTNDAGYITAAEVTGGEWGSITGTLSDQTDLQGALDGKLSLTGGTMTGDLALQRINICNMWNGVLGYIKQQEIGMKDQVSSRNGIVLNLAYTTNGPLAQFPGNYNFFDITVNKYENTTLSSQSTATYRFGNEGIVGFCYENANKKLNIGTSGKTFNTVYSDNISDGTNTLSIANIADKSSCLQLSGGTLTGELKIEKDYTTSTFGAYDGELSLTAKSNNSSNNPAISLNLRNSSDNLVEFYTFATTNFHPYHDASVDVGNASARFRNVYAMGITNGNSSILVSDIANKSEIPSTANFISKTEGGTINANLTVEGDLQVQGSLQDDKDHSVTVEDIYNKVHEEVRGGGAWGEIQGNIQDQSDLVEFTYNKANIIYSTSEPENPTEDMIWLYPVD